MPGVVVKEKMDGRIAIEGPKNLQREVVERLERLKERMRIEQIEIIKNTVEIYTLKRMPDKILMASLNRIQ